MLAALIVTDDQQTAEIVDATLQLEWPDRRTGWLRNGASALEVARVTEPSLIILDLEAGSPDGFEALRALRRLTKAPLVVVADGDGALSGEALDAGADEYVGRPICPLDLSARVVAVVQQSNEVGAERPEVQNIEDGFLCLDFTRREARAGGQRIRLTAIEWRLLHHLVAAEGRPVSSQTLLSALHDGAREMTLYLRTYLRRLREKLEPDPDRPRYLVTERGVGYRFVRPVR